MVNRGLLRQQMCGLPQQYTIGLSILRILLMVHGGLWWLLESIVEMNIELPYQFCCVRTLQDIYIINMLTNCVCEKQMPVEATKSKIAS